VRPLRSGPTTGLSPMPDLYVMWSERSGHYKLGTGDSPKRKRNHRTAQPDMELVAAVTHPSAEAIEERLLSYFGDARIGNSDCLEPTAEVVAWVERFRSFPGVATSEDAIDGSYSMPHLWPWADENSSVLAADAVVNGQLAWEIETRYDPPVGSEGGDGQTSAISESWYTPRPYVDAVREVFGGTIDLDPASCAEANRTIRAEAIFTAESDGLRHRWHGRVYLNPPWGRQGRAKKAFIQRAIDAYERSEIAAAILALNSNATTSAWFAPLFAYPICFPNHRVAHYGPGGSGGAPNSGTVFVYLGPEPERFADVFSRFGAVVPPAYPATRASSDLAEDWDVEEVAA
jgi:hypothetical protein